MSSDFYKLSGTCFNGINVETPELVQFISRSATLKAPNEAAHTWDLILSRLLGSHFHRRHLPSSRRGQLSSHIHRAGSAGVRVTLSGNWYPGHRMVGTFTFICGCEEPLPIQAVCTTYHVRPARTHRGPNDRRVARLAKIFLGGGSSHRNLSRKALAIHLARRLTDQPVDISVWD